MLSSLFCLFTSCVARTHEETWTAGSSSGDLCTESGQTSQGSFSALSEPILTIQCSWEKARADVTVLAALALKSPMHNSQSATSSFARTQEETRTARLVLEQFPVRLQIPTVQNSTKCFNLRLLVVSPYWQDAFDPYKFPPF